MDKTRVSGIFVENKTHVYLSLANFDSYQYTLCVWRHTGNIAFGSSDNGTQLCRYECLLSFVKLDGNIK